MLAAASVEWNVHLFAQQNVCENQHTVEVCVYNMLAFLYELENNEQYQMLRVAAAVLTVDGSMCLMD